MNALAFGKEVAFKAADIDINRYIGEACHSSMLNDHDNTWDINIQGAIVILTYPSCAVALSQIYTVI